MYYVCHNTHILVKGKMKKDEKNEEKKRMNPWFYAIFWLSRQKLAREGHPPLGVFPGSSLVCLGERRSGPIRGATESGDFESDCAGCISGSDTRKSVIESSYSLF